MNEYMIQAEEIITEWNDMTPEQQLKFCQVCVCKAIKRGRTLKPLYDLQDTVQETYCKMLQRLPDVGTLAKNIERRANKGFGDSLAAIVTRAANATMEGIAYRHRKDSKTTSQTTTADGETFDLLDTIAAADNVEESAIFRATLQQFVKGLDETNQKILTGRIQGMTEREISETVFISNVAVHNRLIKMQKTLKEMLN